MAYIICDKRRGNPKINVEVCRRKCEFTEECKSYGKYLKTIAMEEPLDVESHTTALSHDEGIGKEVQPA